MTAAELEAIRARHAAAQELPTRKWVTDEAIDQCHADRGALLAHVAQLRQHLATLGWDDTLIDVCSSRPEAK